jgi:capsular polysaccharide export protein
LIGIVSSGIWKIPYLSSFLDDEVHRVNRFSSFDTTNIGCIAGWGQRVSTKKARALATGRRLPFLCLEDGFLRSFGTGDRFPPLSMVVDELGIYYDSTQPSSLESLLNSPADVLGDIADDVNRAMSLVLAHGLSKYNHAPDWVGERMRESHHPNLPPEGEGVKKVLVIDQTAGDMSVSLGGANAATFTAMLAAARAENPQATVYVKTHPEVSSGRKAGYLTGVVDDARTVVLRQAINPLSLIRQMDKVYVVTSTMGFEALLAGKPVTVFGMPWYAGWGATDDRQRCPRRTRTRSVNELFAAAYFHYTRYLDPVTHERGTIFDVIDWLVLQKDMAARYPGRMLCVGFRRWKAANVKPLLSMGNDKVVFVKTAKAAEELGIEPRDNLVFWGRDAPAGVLELAQRTQARVLHMEDGFIRSVGLGSDLIRPLSLVLDAQGIYFDPTRPSDLEHLLNTVEFSPEELIRARAARDFIVEQGLTKYNLEPRGKPAWPTEGKRVLLVPGQVEDDASIRYGCGDDASDVNTNLRLLKAARLACPDAFIVYKPHPDVTSGNRLGEIALSEARRFSDHVEMHLSVISCIEMCDEIHTMTSLTGFDALLRCKNVITYGYPFYSGWGLTLDRKDKRQRDANRQGRRQRTLTLDELVAGTLLRYPIYRDWELNGYTTCEAALRKIAQTRDRLQASGGLQKLRVGFVRRQWRKLSLLVRTALAPP